MSFPKSLSFKFFFPVYSRLLFWNLTPVHYSEPGQLLVNTAGPSDPLAGRTLTDV